MNKKLIILFGISGSGKTIYRNNYIKKNPETIAISMDDIRKRSGSINDQSFNNLVAKKASLQLEEALTNNKSIIWDNTTLSPKYLRAVYEKLPEDYILEIFYTKRSYDPKACIMGIKLDLACNVQRSEVSENTVMRQHERFVNLITWIKNQAPAYVIDSLQGIEVF